jgi:alpha-glucuronidase
MSRRLSFIRLVFGAALAAGCSSPGEADGTKPVVSAPGVTQTAAPTPSAVVSSATSTGTGTPSAKPSPGGSQPAPVGSTQATAKPSSSEGVPPASVPVPPLPSIAVSGVLTSAPAGSYAPPAQPPPDETGADLWLRYPKVEIAGRLAEYQAAFSGVVKPGDSPTLQVAADELVRGLSGLTGAAVPTVDQAGADGAVIVGTPTSSTVIAGLPLASRLPALGAEGYLVELAEVDGKKVTVVAGNSDVGALYGSFALLRHLQSHQPTQALALTGAPKIALRILNHWDNLNGSVERGYAGKSLWDWGALPGTLSPRYKEYARANASIGINSTVLTNVNADAQVLTPVYLDKVKALADVFRPYGITVYLTARFSAPVQLGGLENADPLEANVIQWWENKVAEIYAKIPDFGGFLVKANSEGQPGPQDYGRTHADGANMLADALEPHGGIVMWRAFVYSGGASDRIRRAYDEFELLEGQFRENVFVQPKNGPLDFQPREPFHPLFGAMPKTQLALELQITKEYLGEDTHLAYLGTMYEEVLKADTHAQGEGSTVARIVDGSLDGHTSSAIAGVANIGNDVNWTGSHFNQANWYVYGRMAWDPDVTAAAIAEEWVRLTLSNDPAVITPVTYMMMTSREAMVNYMTPLGLVHIMGTDHHYGPAPWVSTLETPEWNPTYYHNAKTDGIGFDRTATGSKAVDQYFEPVRGQFAARATVPDDLLLFFHHVGWGEKLSSGRSVWEELVYLYSLGVDEVGLIRAAWNNVDGRIDAKRFKEISDFLLIQHYEARWWRDACLQYFAATGNQTMPSGYAPPAKSLDAYKALNCPTDVTKPRCSAVYTGEPSPAILP